MLRRPSFRLGAGAVVDAHFVAAFGREMASQRKTHHVKADERQFLFAHCSSKGFSLAKRARFADNYKVSTHPPEFSEYMSQDLTNAIRALAMDAVQAANS